MKQLHPMEAKKALAESLTSLFFDNSIAKKEGEEFSKVFSRGKLPEQIPAFSLSSFSLEKASLLNVLASTEKFGSRGEIRRLVKQGAIKLDNERVDDPELEFVLEPNQKDVVIKVGKKIFIRIEK
jgi:tyrosyl-tRNA synthetase